MTIGRLGNRGLVGKVWSICSLLCRRSFIAPFRFSDLLKFAVDRRSQIRSRQSQSCHAVVITVAERRARVCLQSQEQKIRIYTRNYAYVANRNHECLTRIRIKKDHDRLPVNALSNFVLNTIKKYFHTNG